MFSTIKVTRRNADIATMNKTTTLTNPRIKEANSFNRPGEIVGEWINGPVAEAIIEHLTSNRRQLDQGRMDKDEATACFESTLMRHAFDTIHGQVEITPEEWEVLKTIGRRIALKAADAVRPMWITEQRKAKAPRPMSRNFPLASRRVK